MRPPDEVEPAEASRGLFLILGAEPAADLDVLLGSGTVVGVLVPAGAASSGGTDVGATCRGMAVALFTDSFEGAELIDADGVLVEAAEVRGARPRLGDGRLLGARAGISRHQAMVAGEEGADFIAFGDLEHPVSERLIEIIAWWSELFVLPSLVLAARLDEAAAERLAAAGADFLAVALDRDARAPGAIDRLSRAFGLHGTR